MVEGRGRTEAGEVGDMLKDQPPIADVEQRGSDRFAEAGRLVGTDHRHPGEHHSEHQKEGGQQASGATQPKAAEPDRAPPRPLGEQEIGDQVTAEGEKDADPKQPAGCPAEAEMKGDDREHGQRP